MSIITKVLEWGWAFFNKEVTIIDIPKQEELNTCNQRLKVLSNNNVLLQQKLNKKGLENEKEKFWNTKRESTNYTYRAREKTYVDPKIFFTKDCNLPIVVGDNVDDVCYNCLNWVIKQLKYVPDRDKNGRPRENWKFAYETFRDKFGDCEDGSILLANLLLKNKVPYWKVRINVGKTKGEYHCWVTYLNKKNEWVVLDWCYYASESLKVLTWKSAEKYLYIDFSFNEKFCFVNNVRLDR